MNKLINENKIIFLDYGYFLHKAIFGWESQRKKIEGEIAENGYSTSFAPKPTYLCMAMIISSLKLVGINKEDLVVIAIDGRGNWRKDVDPNYKANRKSTKQADEIDWLHWYKEFDNMVETLKLSTPFNYIKIDKLEADDIIAIGVKKFQDKECIIISIDSDFDQLTAYKNVRLFSPKTKEFKIVKNPYESLADKLKKETTDNLITPIISEADFKRRRMIVSLLDLPEWVETKVLDELKNVGYNDYNLEKFPFQKLRVRFSEMYNSNKATSYEKSVKKKFKKNNIKKKEKKNAKRRNNLQNNPQIGEW